MKRFFSATVLFILVALTVVALNKFDTPTADARGSEAAKSHSSRM